MPLDFPDSPVVDQRYVMPNGITYTWDGVKWTLEVESSDLLNYWDRDGVQQHLLPRNFNDLLRFKALGVDYLTTLP